MRAIQASSQVEMNATQTTQVPEKEAEEVLEERADERELGAPGGGPAADCAPNDSGSKKKRKKKKKAASGASAGSASASIIQAITTTATATGNGTPGGATASPAEGDPAVHAISQQMAQLAPPSAIAQESPRAVDTTSAATATSTIASAPPLEVSSSCYISFLAMLNGL